MRVIIEPGTLRGRDLLSVADLSAAEVERVFATATALKAEFRATRRHAERDLTVLEERS